MIKIARYFDQISAAAEHHKQLFQKQPMSASTAMQLAYRIVHGHLTDGKTISVSGRFEITKLKDKLCIYASRDPVFYGTGAVKKSGTGPLK